ncbi:MAG: CPBP family intramembrane metalloprotease [Clostridia bacterium]|nr:CPBP family intramembrane metalloprotease [Clostridia bacterium]
MQQPYPGGYYYSPTPVIPVNPEKQSLRRDAGYIGLTMLSVTAAMQFTYVAAVALMIGIGVLTPDALNQFQLGMNNTAYLCFYGVVYALSMAVPAVLVALCCRRRYFPLSPAKPCPGGVALFGVLAAVGGCMLTSIVVSVILSYLSQFGVPMPESPEMMVNTPTSMLLSLVVMAVLPAIFEEMVFRGYVLRTLRPYGDWFAVVVSALLFGLIHGNIQQVPFAFVVGILLGWLYVSTDNIWLPMVVHFCNNATSVLLEYFGFSLPEMQMGLLNMLVIGALIGLGVVAAIVLCVRYREIFSLRRNATSLTLGERVGGLFSSPAFVISIIIFILLMWVVLALS